MNYYLMHKDNKVAYLEFDLQSYNVYDFKTIEAELLPLYIDSKRAMRDWWSMRAIPLSIKRTADAEFMYKNNINSKEHFLLKNYGLSLSDCYWIKPIDSDITFSQINFYDNDFETLTLDKLKTTILDKKLTPLATTTGNMLKFWHIEKKERVLTKGTSGKTEGILQCTNEVFGSYILHKLNKYSFVQYTLSYTKDDNVKSVTCPIFTSKNIEYIPMLNMIEENKVYAYRGKELQDVLIKNCVKVGINQKKAKDFFAFLNCFDFLISNTDRHLNNFGLLRDTDTLQYIGFAPIFDNGNSMFYDNTKIVDTNDFKHLKTELSSMYSDDKKLFASIKKTHIPFDLKILPDAKMLYDFYKAQLKSSFDENMVNNICKGWTFKIQTLDALSKVIDKQKDKIIER